MSFATRYFDLHAVRRASARRAVSLFRDTDGTLVLRLFGAEVLLAPKRKVLALADRAPRPAIAIATNASWKVYRVRGRHCAGLLRRA
jgi:hypothetical protein